ncbi:MAG: hypothetical protein LBS96_06325 [Oscillospiraceae bacterium]|nr:hypothetical protein [Oscillospiraceae bacterium]
MKKVFLLAAALLLLGGCGVKEAEVLPSTAAQSTAQTGTQAPQAEQTEQANATAPLPGSAATGVDVINTDGTATQATAAPGAAAKTPTNADYLALYTEIMNTAKREKIAFKKVQYQEAPKEKRNANGRAVKILEPFLGVMFTSKDKAEKNPVIAPAGGSMEDFPVVQSEKGCYLTDASWVKSAGIKTLANGNTQLTLVLKDEKNAEPYWWTKRGNSLGGVFDFARKQDFDDALASMPIQNPQYDLNYYDCTAILEYNRANKFVRLEQYTHGLAVASFTVLGGRNELQFVVDDTTVITVN